MPSFKCEHDFFQDAIKNKMKPKGKQKWKKNEHKVKAKQNMTFLI